MTKWLDVEVDSPLTGLNVLPTSLLTLDLQNDEDYKLLIGDLSTGDDEKATLKVFRGATLISEISLPATPVSIVDFYAHELKPPTLPFVAVALGSAVYVYKNLKLYFKYYLPPIQVSAEEEEIWRQIKDENVTSELVVKLIRSLKSQPFSSLSWQSQDLIFLKPEQQKDYILKQKEQPLHRTSEVSCMAFLKMRMKDKYGASCLILGIADGNILFLDPQTFSIINHAKVCNFRVTPFQMVATGLYEVDYRITVATSERLVCLLKRDTNEGRVLFETHAQIIQMEVMSASNCIMVVCMDQTVTCYNKKGKKQWILQLESYPITTTLIKLHHLGVEFLAVALNSGLVQIYNGKALVDTIFVREVVSAMKFGQLGQADHVLIILTMEGNLQLKILKRTAEFDLQSSISDTVGGPNSALAQLNKPLVIPKKSKLFVEQALREKENAVDMHKSFQRDLNMLRLSMARILIEAHTKSENAVGVGKLENIRLSAEVEGLGPIFKVTLILENNSKDTAIAGLSLVYHVNPADYKVHYPYIKVPYLVPGTKLKFPTKIEEVFTCEDELNPDILFRNITGQASERATIKVLLVQSGKSCPVLAASIQMPPTDPMMLPLDKMQSAINFV